MSEEKAKSKYALELQDVTKEFHQGEETLHILKDINFSVRPGEVVALVGPSGSGKSTLLQIAGLLEVPSSGKVIIGGVDTSELSERRRTYLRRQTLGFIYQYHHLLPEFTALENVMLAELISATPQDKAKDRAKELLTHVGLDHRFSHYPSQLSGGEQQRVAVVRALANRPAVLLADEPTGNLDQASAEVVFGEFIKLARNKGVAAIVATHNMDLAKRMDRIVTLSKGTLK